MNGTIKEYYKNPLLCELKAKIIEIDEEYIILDKTIAYPEGGGQQGDIGEIILENGEKINFIDTQKGLGRTIYLGDFPIINVETEITKGDKLSFILALIAIIFWLFIKNDLIAISLITFIEAMAFYPTIRKSFKKPFEETLSTYILASIRALISIFALAEINLITIMYPLFLVFICGGFSLQLIILRKKYKTLQFN